MKPTSQTATQMPDLITSAASTVDFASVSSIPAGVTVENMRRRGIDMVQISWSLDTANEKSWRYLMHAVRLSARVLPKTTLMFSGQKLHILNKKVDGAEATTVVPLADLVAVELSTDGANTVPAVRLLRVKGVVELGEGLPAETLTWLRDKILLEAAGLSWKPIFNVDKRTTRVISNPDDQPYKHLQHVHGRLVESFLEQASEKVTALVSSLEARDKKTARTSAHWLKSSSAAVGATQLSELCQRVELDIDGNDVVRAAELGPHISNEFEKVAAALREHAGVSGQDQGAGTDETVQAAPADGPLAGIRVLVAEDSLVNQELARECLESAGCRVTLASGGREALDQFQSAEFDVVLMDCQMPELDGLHATRLLREIERKAARERTPVIALTANALRDDRNLCIAADMDDYLSKPYTEAALIETMTRWLPKQDGMPAEAETDKNADDDTGTDAALGEAPSKPASNEPASE